MAAVWVFLVLHLIQIDLIIRLEDKLKAGLNNLFFHFNHMETHMENLHPIHGFSPYSGAYRITQKLIYSNFPKNIILRDFITVFSE